MTWQGIPFLIDYTANAVTPQLSYLLLDKLPTVTVESSFSLETIIAALIAGGIPAWIAYIAIGNSNKQAIEQHRMQSQAKINEEIRIAAANYVTAVNQLSSEFQMWAVSTAKTGLIAPSKEAMPDNLKDAAYRAESNKNTMLLLIYKDEHGEKLIESMNAVQTALDPLLNVSVSISSYLTLKIAVGKFMEACHEYFLRK
ncbi:hypothetical protein ABKS85_09510 [Citrobacter freundii]|uniref:hypothetical protein n=1 Tax=Citrobacter freundii TaxID=546 RepID=UPI0032AFD2C6